MGKKGKSAAYGISLAAALVGSAINSEAYAQQDTTRQNRIYSGKIEYSASGEGILLKNFVPHYLPDSTINLGERFGLYAERGNLSWNVSSTKKGLENILSFLRSGVQTPEKRESINYIQRLLQTVSEPDSASLNALRRAVANGNISQSEMKSIQPNTYIIAARSQAMQGYKAETLPILVNIKKPYSAALPAQPREVRPGARQPIPRAPARPTQPAPQQPRQRTPERRPVQPRRPQAPQTPRDTTPQPRDTIPREPREPERLAQDTLPPYIRISGDTMQVLNYTSLTTQQRADANRRVREFSQGRRVITMGPRTYVRQPEILPTRAEEIVIGNIRVSANRDTLRLTKPYAELNPLEKKELEITLREYIGKKVKEIKPGVYVAKKEEPEKEREKRKYGLPVRATLDGFYGEEKILGGAIGFGYGPIGFSVNYSQRGNKTIEELTVPLSRGRQGIGRRDEIDFRSFGGSIELHPWIFFANAGANLENHTIRVGERIVSSQGNDLKNEANSKAETKTSGRFAAGIDVPLGRFGLRGFAGYDTRRGKFAGVGISVKLSRPHRKQDGR